MSLLPRSLLLLLLIALLEEAAGGFAFTGIFSFNAVASVK